MSEVIKVLDVTHPTSDKVDFQGYNTAELVLQLLQRCHWATYIDFSGFLLEAVTGKPKVKSSNHTSLRKALENPRAQGSCTCLHCDGASVLAWPLHLPICGTMLTSGSAVTAGQLLLLRNCPLGERDVQHRRHRRWQCPFSAVSTIPMGSCRFLTFSFILAGQRPGLQQYRIATLLNR